MYLYTPLSNLPKYPVVTSPDRLVPDLKKAMGVGEEKEVVGGAMRLMRQMMMRMMMMRMMMMSWCG